MSTYKLYYFDIKGLGESLRLLMHYGNIDFEDIRISYEEWPALKPSMPMGQIPVLEVDGKRAHQSVALTRFLSKKVGLTGNNAWVDLQIDMVVDTINDLRKKITLVTFDEKDEKVKEKKLETLKNDTIPFYLERLEAIAKENKGYLALGKLTWADFYLAGLIGCMSFLSKCNLLENRPNLQKVVDNVLSIDQVKKWVKKRPVTNF